MKSIAKKIIFLLAICVAFYSNLCMAHVGQSDIAFFGIHLGTDINAIEAKYGEPDDKRVFNRYDSGSLERIKYSNGTKYDNRVEAYALNRQIYFLKIKQTGLPTAAGIQVGDAIDKAISIYGEPDERSSSGVCYTAIDDKNKSLEFAFKNGIIDEISISDKSMPLYMPFGWEGTLPLSQIEIGGLKLKMKMSEVNALYGIPATYRNGVANYSNGVSVYYTTDSLNGIINDVIVTENKGVSTRAGIRVGMGLDSVISTYGTPDSIYQTKDECTYFYNCKGDDRLSFLGFVVKNNVITKMFMYWTD